MSNELEAYDFLGQEIKVGDLVVFPNRAGSNMWLRQMTVERIEENAKGNPVIYGIDETGKKTRTAVLKRCAVVDKYTIIL